MLRRISNPQLIVAAGVGGEQSSRTKGGGGLWEYMYGYLVDTGKVYKAPRLGVHIKGTTSITALYPREFKVKFVSRQTQWIVSVNRTGMVEI